MSPLRPQDFEIALVCALRLEYDAVCLLFDTFWDEQGDRYGRVPGDSNTYTTGRIRRYNVVLALLPNMVNYQGLRLAILVGICGGIPFPNANKESDVTSEVLLGDVVISQKFIQYDLGKRYPNAFVRRDAVEDNLNRPNKDIRSLLATLETEHGRGRLQQGAATYLGQLQEVARGKNRRTGYAYPGTSEDRLFHTGYRHKHHDSEKCLIPRRRLKLKAELEANVDTTIQAHIPTIHIGQIASGDTLVKSGEDPDVLAKEINFIAFEMEGSGVWDELPCIIVKGVADYADCHKNHIWQDFAAATVAAAMKALLDRYVRTDRGPSPNI
ncbi:nucleoside phosphorylase domain-containing protein [Aspergillus carlsbadensis]|nr:nucleoside phosphorylase domain-containing protein [Aspergillus carlsbadensis]